jgi:deazaflavin-dependent oxidoreductase (nitroreductase family)
MNEQLFGQAHVDRYRETDGEEGHDWRGTQTLLLTTTGRKSGEKRTTPLIYGQSGGDVMVVASNGGGDAPGWYRNIEKDPQVDVQIGGEKFSARARVATAEEKPDMWRRMTEHWPPYDEYQEHADREIPVVILERVQPTI